MKNKKDSKEVTDRFRTLVETVDGIFWEANADTFEFTYVSPQVEDILGYAPSKWYDSKKFWQNHIHPKDRAQAIQYCHKKTRQNENHTFEYRMVTADEEVKWLRDHVTVVHKKGVKKLYGMMVDITSQKNKLHDIVKHSTNMFYRHDTNHVITYVSPQSEDFLGYSPEESMKHWSDFVTDHPINRVGFKKTQKAIDTGETQPPFQLQLQKKSGELIWVQVNEAPIVEDGESVAIVGSLSDITEQKRYEKKLEQLSLVASKTTDVIIMTDAEFKITWVNKAFEDLLDYNFKEVVGTDPSQILKGPNTNTDTSLKLEEAVHQQNSVQVVILYYSKQGDTYWLDITMDPIIDRDNICKGFIANIKDISRLVEQQRELQNTVEQYNIVSKATSDTIWDLNLQSKTIRYNKNIYGMFGYDKQEVQESAEWWRDKIHPDDRERVIDTLNNALNSESDRFQINYRFKGADGSYKDIYDRAFIVTDEKDNSARIIGAMQDITKQKEEQKWLQLFESAVANTTESVAILEGKPTNLSGRQILYVNKAFSQMTGYAQDEVTGNTLNILNGPGTSQKEWQKISQGMNGWETHEAEFILFKKNGEEFWIHVSVTPVKSGDGVKYWVCVGRDVTERQQREAALRESLREKETLLLEIHHRVKNNLAVVSGIMQLQAFDEENEKFESKLYDSVARIQTMASIHELLYQSKNFSKLDFEKNTKQLITSISKTFQSNLELDVTFDVEAISLNINQAIPCSLIINEVVTNIFKHAFNKGENGLLSIKAFQKDDKIYLSIKDNGNGLPFDFNNTDRPTLGLKLIETLSHQLEADYRYDSLEEGTAFSISFKKSNVKGVGNARL